MDIARHLARFTASMGSYRGFRCVSSRRVFGRGVRIDSCRLVGGTHGFDRGSAAALLFEERVTLRQWSGLLLGFIGVGFVLVNKISLDGLSVYGIAMAAVALFSITAGTVYQKRFCGHFDLRSGAVIQFVSAGLVLAPMAFAFETRQIEWSRELVLAMIWLVVVLSIVSIALLTLIIRRGASTQVASLFYLVPPATALEAYLMFNETLSGMAILGMVLAIIGVALVSTQAQSK